MLLFQPTARLNCADYPVAENFMEETMNPRLASGSGDWDTLWFLRVLGGAGVDAPICVGVMRRTPPDPDEVEVGHLLDPAARAAVDAAKVFETPPAGIA